MNCLWKALLVAARDADVRLKLALDEGALASSII